MRNSILGTFGTATLALSFVACGACGGSGTTSSSDPTHPISPLPPSMEQEAPPPPATPMVTLRRVGRAPGEKTTVYVYSASTIAAGGNDVTQFVFPETGIDDAVVKQEIAAHSTVLVWTDAPAGSHGRFFADIANDAVLVAPGLGYARTSGRIMKLRWSARPAESMRGTVCDQFVQSEDTFIDIDLPEMCGGSKDIPITLYSFKSEDAQARTRLSVRPEFGSEVQMPMWDLPELSKLSVVGSARADDYDVRVRAVKDGVMRSGMHLMLRPAWTPTIIHDSTADFESIELTRGLNFTATFGGPRTVGDVQLDMSDLPSIVVKRRPLTGERGFLDIETDKPLSGAFATTLYTFAPKLWVDLVQPLATGSLSTHLAMPKLPVDIEALAVAAGGNSVSTLVQQNPNLTLADVFARKDLALVPGRTVAIQVF